jgi:hypothetical protein
MSVVRRLLTPAGETVFPPSASFCFQVRLGSAEGATRGNLHVPTKAAPEAHRPRAER